MSHEVEAIQARHKDIVIGIDTPDIFDVDPVHVLAMFRQAHADRGVLLAEVARLRKAFADADARRIQLSHHLRNESGRRAGYKA